MEIASQPIGGGVAIEIGDDQIDWCKAHIGGERQLRLERPHAQRRRRCQHGAEDGTQRRVRDQDCDDLGRHCPLPHG
jgi:hypothetical protein